jgi:hypothetical protein
MNEQVRNSAILNFFMNPKTRRLHGCFLEWGYPKSSMSLDHDLVLKPIRPPHILNWQKHAWYNAFPSEDYGFSLFAASLLAIRILIAWFRQAQRLPTNLTYFAWDWPSYLMFAKVPSHLNNALSTLEYSFWATECWQAPDLQFLWGWDASWYPGYPWANFDMKNTGTLR